MPTDPLHPRRRRRKDHKQPDGPVGPDGTGDGDANRGGGEFTQLALWMAASLAGMVTALLVARRPFFESLLRTAGGNGGPAAGRRKGGRSVKALSRPTAEESLPMLAEAIVGNSKAAVASVFGPPRGAAVRGAVKPTGKTPPYWQANTWYYPLPRNDALAMAIEFDDDNAKRVEFFRAPGL